MRAMLSVAVLALSAVPSESPARPATALTLRVDPAIAHISAARELPDGSVLVSDAKKPALYVLDPKTGRATVVGSAGVGDEQYVQPGGFYDGPNGTTLLLDRGQARVLTLSRDGRIVGSASIAVRGTQSASDRDVDLQRVDARGFAYFPQTSGFFTGGSSTTPLLRFEPIKQQTEAVTTLGLPLSKQIAGGDRMTFSRRVIGSPADGWGVTPDGRVAVVRAAPYRVEWYAPDRKVVRGPVVEHDPLPMTEDDKQAFRAKSGRGSVSVGVAGGGAGQAGDPGILFATTKAPFDPEDVVVSSAGKVWVKRTAPHGARTVTYDVFDNAGRRTARVELPDGSDVIGFGPAAIYVRERRADGGVTLKKYADK